MSLFSALRSAFGSAPVLHVAPPARASSAARQAAPRAKNFQQLAVAAGRRMVLSGGGSDGSKTTNYTEPSVRVWVTWTPEQRRAAIQMADAGTLIRAADLCEAMLGDDRIPGVLNTRANALLGTELDFEESAVRGKKTKTNLVALGIAKPKGKLVAELEEDWWEMFPEEELRRLIMWGVFLGVGLAQIVYEAALDGQRLIPRLQVWHPRFLRWDATEQSWFVRVDELANEIPITPGDGKWVLFTPYGSSRPWSLGLWRGLSLMWLLKVFACRDWALHSEIHGSPIRVGTLGPTTQLELQHGTDAVRKDLAADLANIGNDTSIVLPSGFSLDLVEAKARTWEMFQAQIQLANTSIAISTIGSNLPTEVGARIATGATAATLVRNDYTAADGQSLATTLHRQVLPFWAKLNFGVDTAPWGRWLTEPPVDQAALSLTWQQVGNAVGALAAAGKVITNDQLKDKFDIEVEDAADDAAPAPPALGAKGAPPAPGAKPAALSASAGHHVHAAAQRHAEKAHAAGDRAVADSARDIAAGLEPVVRSIAAAAERARHSDDPKREFRRQLRALAALDLPEGLVTALEAASRRGFTIGREHATP